jgi:hypothetical protein
VANATARVGRAFVSWTDENLTHSWGTLSSSLQLYSGAMVGYSAGYFAKYDDTAAMKFAGIILEDHGNPKLPNTGATSGTAGDGTMDLDIKQPKAFELNISGVAITDIGRRVYALDDQTGTLDPSATTYANMIGVVKDLVYATNPGSAVANYALVTPVYDQAQGAQLQVFGANGALAVKGSTVIITKGSAAALTLADPTSGANDGLLIDIVSTTAFAHTLVAPSGYNVSGTTATWGGAKGDSLQLVAYGGKWYTNGQPRNITFS